VRHVGSVDVFFEVLDKCGAGDIAATPKLPSGWGTERTMPIEVFFMVPALVHATWNALVKADGDRLSLIELMSGTQVVDETPEMYLRCSVGLDACSCST
jgi:hypothetical protein